MRRWVRLLVARAWPLALTACTAALILGWNLGERYLWQDEAATAVLGERMMRYGRPLAYDGVNLVTMDFRPPHTSPPPTDDAEAAVEALAAQGEFKDDATWTGAPWGQYLVAGVSLEIFGRKTWAARAPFVGFAVAAAVLLHLLARRLRDPRATALAIGLLLTNVFWILHMRQCRYYPLTGFFLVASLLAYLRWQEGRPWAAAHFVGVSWLFFQCDYGTFWPVMAVLGVHALLSPPATSRGRAVATFAALGAAVAPWVVYFELWTRGQGSPLGLQAHFLGHLFNVNQYQLPLLAIPFAVLLIARARGSQRRLLGLALACCLALPIWYSVAAGQPFYRYVVAGTPLAALLLAALIATASRMAYPGSPLAGGVSAVFMAGVLALTPLASFAGGFWIPSRYWSVYETGYFFRVEIPWFLIEYMGGAPDPNRDVIEALRPRLRPGDEILVNYGDVPWMFYTDYPVRGGISAFRVEDPTSPPRLAVIRRSASFVEKAAFKRELARHRWRRLPLSIPDISFGNSPDPSHREFPLPKNTPPITVLERLPESNPAPEEP